MRLLSTYVDERLKQGGELFFNRILERKTLQLRKLSDNIAEKKRFERWIRHKEVSMKRIIETEQHRVQELVKGHHVLGIQDTTEINYEWNAGRHSGLGTVGNGKDAGFFMHPMLVIDAGTGAGIGYATAHLWNRTKSADENYRKLPIEEKESYRWITTAEKSKAILSSARCVTFMGDRENDIYEYIDRIPNDKTHFIVRVRCDRKLLNESTLLYEYLDHLPSCGELMVEVVGDVRKKRKKRTAQLAVKYSVISIARPEKCSDQSASRSVKLYVVEAKEINCPVNEKPIHWRLYTTHLITSYEEAVQIILWYRMRWLIEQIFRTLKSQGLGLEDTPIESAEALMKLSLLALSAAIQIIQLVYAREGTTTQQTELLFTKEERRFLKLLLLKTEGKTEKQKNPYPRENLAWATWIIARLGGWMGYAKSEGLPGPIVVARGLQRFYDMFHGWKLYKDMSTE